jgi:sugar lactone lactonase YvrE
MTRIVIEDLGFPEDPRWHDGELWFSDMDAGWVFRMSPGGRATQVVQVPGTPSGLGWLPDGRLLVVSMSDRKLLRLDAEAVREAADLSRLASFRCNDMVVDGEGRAYIGTFGFDFEGLRPFAPGEIILCPPRGVPRVVADGLAFPNGLAITPDGNRLIVSETLGERLTGFDIGPDGSLRNRRVWAALPSTAPDGISLDAEGAVWVASPVSGAVFRVREGGEVTDRVAVSTQAYSCRLGGPERQTLYITTSYPLPSLFSIKGLPAPSRETPRARMGKIEAIDVKVPGAGFP